MVRIFCLERWEILLERAERRVNISPSSFQFRGEVKRFDSNRFNWTISRHCPWTVTKGRPRYFTAVEERRDVTNIVAEREQSRTRVSQMAIGVYRHPPYLTPGQSLPPSLPFHASLRLPKFLNFSPHSYLSGQSSARESFPGQVFDADGIWIMQIWFQVTSGRGCIRF